MISDVEAKAAAEKFIAAHQTLVAAREVVRATERNIKEAETAANLAVAVLKNSVSPICGSACQPNRRIYKISAAEVLVVDWDHGRDEATIRWERFQ